MTPHTDSAVRQFRYYRQLGEQAMAQLEPHQLFLQPTEESNSIAVIVKHMHGNMLSRWTNFLTEDGEKSWRNRDAEFECDARTREEVMDWWNEGWNCLFNALAGLTDEDLSRIVYIRNEGDTVLSAILRQLTHYAYHVGQIVYLAKMIRNRDWNSLSIPRNQSAGYNEAKFSQEKGQRPFLDDRLRN